MKQYDYVIAGGGAAGLSLAYHLMRSSLRDRRVLIVDREPKNTNDRTWCFWSQRPTHFSPIYFRSWEKFAFQSAQFSHSYDIFPYRYNLLRGIDFYEFARAELSARPNIEFLSAPINQVWDTPEGVNLSAGSETFQADWAFDSRFNPLDIQPDPRRYHYLKQHFMGWEVETDTDVFDPSLPVLFDFRTPQKGTMRFIYILPFSSRTALVEYTLFSANLLTGDEYETGLRDYLKQILHVEEFSIRAVERGIIPMTDHPFQRKGGARILNIGTRGGRVKPSSGYAFLRIQQDSNAIVRSLEKNGHPFQLDETPSRYRLLDSILLQVLYRRGDLAETIFTDLFRHNPVERILGFLDERGGIWDNLRVVSSVPPLPFIKAWMRLKINRSV